MTRNYSQYCPIAHALDLVGERWSLLVVRELSDGPRRYTDLLGALDGCGTNVLAARLRHLEQGGVVRRRRLPPPAASTIYELTAYGDGLRPVLAALAWWGIHSLGPPAEDTELPPGWLPRALRTALGGARLPAALEFRAGGEVATVQEGEARSGHAEAPATVVETTPAGLFHLLVEGDLAGVTVAGDRSLLERLLADLAPSRRPAPASTA